MIRINEDLCRGCGACVEACPHLAIQVRQGLAVLDSELCDSCGDCIAVCPCGAIQALQADVVGTAVVSPGFQTGGTEAALEEARSAAIVSAEPVQQGRVEIVDSQPAGDRRSPDVLRGLALVGGSLLGSFVDTLLERRQARTSDQTIDGAARYVDMDPGPAARFGGGGRGNGTSRRGGRGRGNGRGGGRGMARSSGRGRGRRVNGMDDRF